MVYERNMKSFALFIFYLVPCLCQRPTLYQYPAVISNNGTPKVVMPSSIGYEKNVEDIEKKALSEQPTWYRNWKQYRDYVNKRPLPMNNEDDYIDDDQFNQQIKQDRIMVKVKPQNDNKFNQRHQESNYNDRVTKVNEINQQSDYAETNERLAKLNSGLPTICMFCTRRSNSYDTYTIEDIYNYINNKQSKQSTDNNYYKYNIGLPYNYNNDFQKLYSILDNSQIPFGQKYFYVQPTGYNHYQLYYNELDDKRKHIIVKFLLNPYQLDNQKFDQNKNYYTTKLYIPLSDRQSTDYNTFHYNLKDLLGTAFQRSTYPEELAMNGYNKYHPQLFKRASNVRNSPYKYVRIIQDDVLENDQYIDPKDYYQQPLQYLMNKNKV